MKYAPRLLAALTLLVLTPLVHAQDASQDGTASDHGYVRPGSQPGDTNMDTSAVGAGVDPVSGKTKPSTPDFQIASAPDDGNSDTLQQALADFKAGRLEAAAATLTALIRKAPDNATAHSLLGYIYLKQSKNTDAVRELETVVKLAPADLSGHRNLGRAYLQTGQMDAAATQFRLVLAKMPKDPDALLGVALTLGQSGKNDEAAAAFQNLIAVAPSAMAYQDLGITLNKSGKTAQAADAFHNAAALEPKNAVTWFNAGLLYAQAKQNEDSVDALTHALALGGPEKFEAYVTRGRAYAALKQSDKALSDFAAASTLHPTDPMPLYNVALLQQNAGQTTAAEASYRKVLALKPTDVQIVTGTQSNLGLLLASDSNAAEALPLLEQGVQSDPNNAALHSSLADVYAKQGDTAKAIAERRTVLTLAPEDNNNRALLADLLAGQKDYAGALTQYKEAAHREPKNASLQNALGGAYVQAGNLAGARDAYTAALVADPKNAQAQNNLGVVYDRQGKTALAIAAYKKALALDPTLTLARKNLARLSGK